MQEEEVECLRGAHDRRLQRMEALQQEHRLVLKQIKTYEAHGSVGNATAARTYMYRTYMYVHAGQNPVKCRMMI